MHEKGDGTHEEAIVAQIAHSRCGRFDSTGVVHSSNRPALDPPEQTQSNSIGYEAHYTMQEAFIQASKLDAGMKAVSTVPLQYCTYSFHTEEHPTPTEFLCPIQVPGMREVFYTL